MFNPAKKILFIGFLSNLIVIIFCIGNVNGQVLRVDSVTVGSNWVSDSDWVDNLGKKQKVECRRSTISFLLQGTGMARIFFAISIDSGKTWLPPSNSIFPFNSILIGEPGRGTKATIPITVFGGDRLNVSFKVTAREAAPTIETKLPKIVYGFPNTLESGANISTVLSINRADTSDTIGYSSFVRVYWDAFADGSVDDSTIGPNMFKWTFHTRVPGGVSGQRQKVIARAIDCNGLLSKPETLAVQFGLLRPSRMINVSGGNFIMGDTLQITSKGDSSVNAKPLHPVTLSAFRIQEAQVTQEQYLAVMNTNPAFFKEDLTKPVESVDWYSAAKYCNALSMLSGLTCAYDTNTWTVNPSANGYRLPTEAQWEFACRGGTATPYWWGNDTNGCGARAWADYLDSNSNITHPVATKLPNPFGLFDMPGNVREWCNDWHGTYSSIAQVDPMGPGEGLGRVIRGGCFGDDPLDLRSGIRYWSDPIDWTGSIGFRVALPSNSN